MNSDLVNKAQAWLSIFLTVSTQHPLRGTFPSQDTQSKGQMQVAICYLNRFGIFYFNDILNWMAGIKFC